MRIKCVAIDDEPLALEKLTTYIQRVPFLELVGSCNDTTEALKVLSENKIDVIFTDINMPDMNGMEFVSSLSNCPLVVFTTAYSEYAVDSYKMDAVEYLLKPYGFYDFQRVADKVRTRYELLEQQKSNIGDGNSLFIKEGYKWVRISIDKITHIQGYSDYLKIFLCDSNKPLLTHSTFGQIMNNLPKSFLQVHRSYIVNMDMVKEIERLRIFIDDDTQIPVGDIYRDDFMEYLQIYSVGNNTRKQKDKN